ncbi:redoxin domain-containing protein [Dysgonomonas sp. 25]|uniref:redoxin domain-containing protein n=1 Tax=Dysgonomonas sp. 25 TaxID=2302933 RepID=UPI0013D7CD1F|nr:redoxin domain-containing protein [Dysgonomonas sp. 25]NDV70097.1 peroxiredoxin [Dysgonomonas sp. 25]
MLANGTKAPDFKLNCTPDQELGLSELKGKNVILVFYPADWSPVCSDEMSLFNLSLPLFEKHNAIVIGISVDSKWSHMAFAKERQLKFPLLADFEPKGAISKLYESYDEKGHSKRSIYLIDKDGVIRWSYLSPEGINPGVDGVLDALEKLTK